MSVKEEYSEWVNERINVRGNKSSKANRDCIEDLMPDFSGFLKLRNGYWINFLLPLNKFLETS